MTPDPAGDARAAITLARAMADDPGWIGDDPRLLARGVLALLAAGERLRFLLEHAPSPAAFASCETTVRPGWAGDVTQADVDGAVYDWLEATTERGRSL